MKLQLLETKLVNWLSRKKVHSSSQDISGPAFAVGSDTGLTRSRNEDQVVLLKANMAGKRYFAAVLCDGMGGMRDGAECAALTVAAFIATFISEKNASQKLQLQKASLAANDRVYSKYRGEGGATLSAFSVDSGGNYLGINVGDSRIYVLSDRKLIQLSKDDTLAGHFENNSDEDNRANQLLQYIGIGKDIEPHSVDFPKLMNFSKVLITSDGIHSVPHSILEPLLFPPEPSITIVRRLLALSNWVGGRDNGSVFLGYNKRDVDNAVPGHESPLVDFIEIFDSQGELTLFVDDLPTSTSSEKDIKNVSPDIKPPPKRKRKRKPPVPKLKQADLEKGQLSIEIESSDD